MNKAKKATMPTTTMATRDHLSQIHHGLSPFIFFFLTCERASNAPAQVGSCFFEVALSHAWVHRGQGVFAIVGPGDDLREHERLFVSGAPLDLLPHERIHPIAGKVLDGGLHI